MKHYDIVVIGSGAGMMVSQAARQSGVKCALIEEQKLGGTCLNRGCIPSKILVHPADLVRDAQQAERSGVSLKVEQVSWPKVSKRMWNRINISSQLEQSIRDNPDVDLYKSHAAFIDPHTLELTDENNQSVQVKADRILIAAGGRTFIPPVSGLEEAGFITSETFFGDAFPEKPWKDLIIMGGGAVGCEFAHIMSAMGTQVTLVEMASRLVGTEEPEISQMLEQQMSRFGVRVLTGQTAIQAESSNEMKKLIVKNKQGETQTITAEEILVATGIRSNADGLKLENAGVKTDEKGWIISNEFLETSVPHIFALGDINGKFQFRHKANYEADVLIHNLFSGSENKRQAQYTTVPWAVFTWPQIAHVGMTEAQALETGKRIKVGKNYYSMTAGGYALGYEPGDPDDGFVKLIADESSKILGVHIVGPHASILIQSFVYLMNAGFTCQSNKEHLPIPGQSGARLCLEADSIEAIDQSMVIHPALSEVAAWVTGELEWVN